MNASQALAIIYQAAGLAHLTRAEHLQVDTAATLLGKHLAPPAASPPAAAPPAAAPPAAAPPV